jgi:hypothetical protein
MNLLKPILSEKHVQSVRRNHALEHATLNILRRRAPQYQLSGYSDMHGFWVFGEIPTDELSETAHEALRRLSDGEGQLAIHPYCGTNYAVMGIAAGVATWVVLLGMKKDWRDRLDRLSLAVAVSTLAVVGAQPLGPKVQKHITTEAAPGNLEIEKIEDVSRAFKRVHRIHTNVP